MNYNDSLNFIKAKQSLGIKPGLSRIKNALISLSNPQNDYDVVHVAGTNGKGSVCNMIANALHSAGYKVGLFTSPWVTDYREQIQINSNPISKSDFAFYVSLLANYDLTEFELVVAIALKYFSNENVDYAVIECGMGGEGDATNVFDSTKIVAITAVSLDHTAFLGDTVKKIAIQKSGIIKENSNVVLYPNDDVVTKVIKEKCNNQNATLNKIDKSDNFKIDNLNTAQMIINLLGVNQKVVAPDLPARQELVNNNLMIDGAHNPQGAMALRSALFQHRSVTAVIAMMKDKDVQSYMSIIAPLCAKIIVTSVTDNHRAMTALELLDIAKKYNDNVIAVDDPVDAVNMLKEYGEFKLLCGSFYLARQVRKYLI